jgi:hypothetical protein
MYRDAVPVHSYFGMRISGKSPAGWAKCEAAGTEG